MRTVSYALVEDVPASWERYAVLERELARSPRGLLVHVAGPTDEGFRIIEVWQSEADWQRFAAELELAIGSIDPLVVRRSVVRDLRARHIVIGAWPDQTGQEAGQPGEEP